MTTESYNWIRLHTEADFLKEIADRELVAEGMSFTIHSDGTISGLVGSSQLIGSWSWEEEYFCRIAELNGERLGVDCEIIEIEGSRMRYTRNKGAGETSIVDIGKHRR